MKKRNYIAYGSNLNIRQMLTRCPTARILGTSEISGYELLFKGSKTGSYLTIEPAEGGVVPVAVWSVTPEDEERLDRYEGFPTFYYKAEMKLPVTGICSGKVSTQRAFVYIMHEDRPLSIPCSRYIDTCEEGYEDFGFDTELIYEALRRSQRRSA